MSYMEFRGPNDVIEFRKLPSYDFFYSKEFYAISSDTQFPIVTLIDKIYFWKSFLSSD